MSKYFYCYSRRLKDFLGIFGIKYLSIGIHPKTQKKYYLFEKNSQIDFLIEEWNKIKKYFPL